MHACHKDPKVNRWGKFSAILGVVWLVIFIIIIAAWVSAIGQMASAIGGIYGGGGSSSSLGRQADNTSVLMAFQAFVDGVLEQIRHGAALR